MGFRMIDLLCLREKNPKRETRVVNMLWFIQKTLWKVLSLPPSLSFSHSFLFSYDFNLQTLFGKEADRLEQATASESICIPFSLYNKINITIVLSLVSPHENRACAWARLHFYVSLTTQHTSDYLFEDEPLVNKFISVPKDQSKKIIIII